ncbi:hypothetical protein TWF192_008002 [Orbilia oligospora]|uniref:F-box domain-containing protein n=1 Tax=Orbilia oligospora TaxID=2813651 RepID=A0A6G1M4P5_ORBOL|nr:hypothetical protein TWF191_009152 [Orbilia oligospora]KAF3243616.1 hypothetical protein TWF192_008002 [Orbilia oligospora]
MKSGRSVRHLSLANYCGGGIPDTRNREMSLSHMDLLLPQFTTLRSFTIQRRSGSGPPLMTYVSALQQALRTCPSLNEVFIEFRHDIGDVSDLSVLEDGSALEPSVPHPRLLDLTVRLGQMAYNNDLAPTYSLLNLICKMIGGSSQTVRDLRFGIGVHNLHEDFDEALYEQSDWAIISRDRSSKPVMNLPKVEKLILDLTEAVLCNSLFSDFCYVDRDKIRELELCNMAATEPFPVEQNLSRRHLSILALPEHTTNLQWIDMVFEARNMKKLKWLKELRISFLDTEPPADGSLSQIAKLYSSKCKWHDIVKCIDQSVDDGDKVTWMMIFKF